MKSSSDFPIDFPSFLLLSNVHSEPFGLDSNLFPRGSMDKASFAFIASGLEAGIVDPMLPVRGDGSGVLVFWAKQYGNLLPLSIVETVARLDDRLGPKNNNGLLPLASIVHEKLMPSSGRNFDWILDEDVEWIAGCIRLGKISDLLSLDGEQDTPFLGMMKLFEKASRPQWEVLLDALTDKGLNLKEHCDLWAQSKRPPLVAALLDRGVDPLKVLSSGIPLWEAWQKHQVQEINLLLAPVLASAPHALEENEKARYFGGFQKLKEGKRSGLFSERLLAHLTSRADWKSVTDDMGRSAFFHLLLADPASIRQIKPSFGKEAWAEVLAHRDHQGRSVWFYVMDMSNDSTWTDKLTEDMWKHAPSAEDLQGRGLGMQWALMHANNEKSVWRLPGCTYASSSSGPSMPGLSDEKRTRISWDFLRDGLWAQAKDEAVREKDKSAIIRSFFMGMSDVISTVLPEGPGGEETNELFNAMRLWCSATVRPKETLTNYISRRNGQAFRMANAPTIFQETFSGRAWVFPVSNELFEKSVRRLRAVMEKDTTLHERQKAYLLEVGNTLRLGVRSYNLDRGLPSPQVKASKPRF